MPFPLLVAAVVAAGSSAGTYGVKKLVDKYWKDFVGATIEGMGLDIDVNEGLTDETLTKAVNEKLLSGSGVKLDSLLDRQKMRDGFEKQAMQKIALDLGLPPVDSRVQIRGAVQTWLTDQLGAELSQQAGEVIDAAKPIGKMKEVLTLVGPPKPWNMITDTSKAGEMNRARQRRWRQAHTKQWVSKA